MEEQRIRILYVDDEENNLLAFRAYFRKKYEVYTAISASEAFRLLESIEMHVIVSDQRMPITSGVEFLETTIDKYPDTIRLLITGQSDIETVIEAINRGQVSKYLQKPWDWEKFSLILENCTDLYKGKIELKEKNAQLQKTNDELNRFVYSASHDLRSPLMSVLGMVQLAKTDDAMNVAQEYFEIIESNILKLDMYIKNIIDYYRNSRSMEILDVIDFNYLANDVITAVKDQNQEVQIEIETEQEEEFIGDIFRLRIILSNLISNAIKYQNPQASIHKVTVTIKSGPKFATISIADNGIGILNEHIENVFKMFFRTYNATNTQGTGIGLYIVKEALEKIGGNISVVSTPLEGTSFKIVIPNKRS